MNRSTFFPLILAALVMSCDAQNDTITSSLFDMSAAGATTVSGSVNMRSGSIRIESTVNFYDSGGFSGNYGNSQNQVLTIYPAREGDRVAMVLNFFSVEFSEGCTYDVFEIFNGTSTSAPRIDFWCGDGDTFWIPHYFVAANSAGALTIRFKSDGTQSFSGWAASLFPLSSTTGYSISLLRAEGLASNSSRINYTVLGPSQLPTDQGFCISTTNTLPTRTNGASCFTASVNRYGTRVFVQPGLAANQTHYVRAFYTPPGGATVYTSTVTYAPLFKELPDIFERGAEDEGLVPLGPLN